MKPKFLHEYLLEFISICNKFDLIRNAISSFANKYSNKYIKRDFMRIDANKILK